MGYYICLLTIILFICYREHAHRKEIKDIYNNIQLLADGITNLAEAQLKQGETFRNNAIKSMADIHSLDEKFNHYSDKNTNDLSAIKNDISMLKKIIKESKNG